MPTLHGPKVWGLDKELLTTKQLGVVFPKTGSKDLVPGGCGLVKEFVFSNGAT